MHGRELGELLSLLRPLDPRLVLADRLDGLDQSWPRDVGDSEPSAGNRRARALQIDAVVGVPEPHLNAIGIIPNRVI